MERQNEVSIQDLKVICKNWFNYLLSKWHIFVLVGVLSAALGIFYAWVQKPTYTAEITFAPENDKGAIGMYAGLAAQFGLDLGSGGNGVFEGENLMWLLTSKMLIEKALFSPVSLNNSNQLLIDYYINLTIREDKREDPVFKTVTFKDYKPGNRIADSLLSVITKDVANNLVVEKLDKKVDIIVARMTSEDELFSKAFVEQIVNNGIQYYIDYKSGKTKENVLILQRQTDSVRNSLSGGIVSVAASSDLNVNPIRNIGRASTQKKQVDVQVNGQLYAELLKQLELSKIALRKETPLIQIIDKPRLPLEKNKLGRLKGGVIFAFIGTIVAIFFFTIKHAFRSESSQKKVDDFNPSLK